jgi:hypothetical protein
MFISKNSVYITEKKCLDCGQSLNGRLDKKFCGDACRTSYHNRRWHHRSNTIRKINLVLFRNHCILAELMEKGQTMVCVHELQLMGFSPGHYTGMEANPRNTLYFCYDIMYSLSPDYQQLFLKEQRN